MNKEENYGREYFETIYAHLKNEKELVLKAFFDLLTSQKKGLKKILDLGCGEGEFLEICQKAGGQGFGIDISSYALKKAKKKVKGKLIQLDLEESKLPFPEGFFDAVTAFDLFEHLKNPQPVLKDLYRVLKKEGLLFATTPNGGYWPADFFGHFVMNDPTHINIQDRKYWERDLQKAGFKEVETRGCLLFGFPPIADFRHFLRKMRLPVLTKPIFFPVLGLTSELYFFARK